jgi:hypothetical protein
MNQLEKELAEKAIEKGLQVIEIRTGAAQELLPEAKSLPVLPLNISGKTGTVAEFIAVRKHLLHADSCNIAVNIAAGTMQLIVNEMQLNNAPIHSVKSQLSINARISELNLNTGKTASPKELFALLRKYKHFATSKQDFSELLTKLATYRADYRAEINDSNDRRGNSNHGIKKSIEHQLPEGFTLEMPIFGKEKQGFYISIEVDEDGRFSLYSDDLIEKMELEAEKLINLELKAIDNFCFVYFV